MRQRRATQIQPTNRSVFLCLLDQPGGFVLCLKVPDCNRHSGIANQIEAVQQQHQYAKAGHGGVRQSKIGDAFDGVSDDCQKQDPHNDSDREVSERSSMNRRCLNPLPHRRYEERQNCNGCSNRNHDSSLVMSKSNHIPPAM
ncbi:DUF1090 family protein [Pseudomonas sp. GG8]